MKLTVSEAKRQLSTVLDRVVAGEDVVITRAGKPVAKLVASPIIAGKRRRFRLGSAKGEFTVPDDFNAPLPKEIEDLFW